MKLSKAIKTIFPRGKTEAIFKNFVQILNSTQEKDV